MRENISQHWSRLQGTLFPFLKEELGPLTENHQKLATAIDFARADKVLCSYGKCVGRPPEDRLAIAHAFLAKAIYNLPTTRALIDRLKCDVVMRRMCGWERRNSVPSESTFSRVFEEFATSGIALKLQQSFIQNYHSTRLIGHISRDSTPIEAREKPKINPKEEKPKEVKKKGRPKKGETREPIPESRIERQCHMTLGEMIKDLPKSCDVGVKKNSKGYKQSWIGYKLHMDTADGDIPISFLLTSASLHDSQVAIPLSTMTEQKVTALYELMDAAYDSEIIRSHVSSKGRVPLIDCNHRGAKDRSRRFAPHEAVRYKERSTAERLNSNLKDNFGGRFVRVRGHSKILSHLAFGLLALTIEQTIRLIS